MIEMLNSDILINISNFLKLVDIVNLKQINRECNETFDNNYFEIYACILYSKEFWKKAESRNPKISNPLPNLQQELLRIEKFNNALIFTQGKPWTEQEFFEYWKANENYFNKKNKLYN